MAGALNRPGASALGVLVREPQRLGVTAVTRSDGPLRDNSTRRRRDHRQHVLIPVRVNADHVVQLICKHPTDPPASLVGSGGAPV